MTQQEYIDICAQIDCILSELGPDFNDDNPRIERLINLSNKADEYYKEQHTEGYTDIEISLEVQILVKIIRMAVNVIYVPTNSSPNAWKPLWNRTRK